MIEGTDEIRRAAITALAEAAPAARDLAAVRDALFQLNYPHAAEILLARARCAESIPAVLVAEVVPRLADPTLVTTLIALADSGHLELAMSLLDHNAFPEDAYGLQLRACVIAVVLEAPDPGNLRSLPHFRAQLTRHARVTAWGCLSYPDRHGLGVLGALLAQLDDPLVAEAVARGRTHSRPQQGLDLGAWGTAGALQLLGIKSLFGASKAELQMLSMACYSESPIAEAIVSRALSTHYARAAVGRNEPCPCGSGKKYKRCHGSGADASALPFAMPIPPPTPLPTLRIPRDPSEIHELTLAEMARVPLGKLDVPTLFGVLDRFLKYQIWDHAARVVEESTRRAAYRAIDTNQFRLRLANVALDAGRFDVVETHVRELPDDMKAHGRQVVETALAIGQGTPDALPKLLTVLDLALKDPTRATAVNLAAVLHVIAPALTLMILRASITPEDVSELLPFLERTGTRLGIREPETARTFGDVVAQLRRKTDEQTRLATAAQTEARELRATLADVQRLAREQAAEIERLRAERFERVAASPLPVEPAELRALKAKIEDLQTLIRERNVELADLRKSATGEPDTTAASSPIATATSSPSANAADSADSEEWEADDEREQPLRVPAWTPAAVAALRAVPSHVGREALRTVAELAAGERNAWRGVKRPKGSRIPLVMSRIGIHHRLLVRVEISEIAALDLVSRESLMLTLKKYTRAG